MKTLTVLYDARCEPCVRARGWLASQPKHVPMAYVPAGSMEARMLFPDLDHEASLGDLTVVADDGSTWRGAKAWVMVLWALEDYRGWAMTIVQSGHFAHAKTVIDAVSRNRHRLGWLSRLLAFA